MARKDHVFSHERRPLLYEVRKMHSPIDFGRRKVAPALKYEAPLRCMGEESFVEGSVVVKSDFAVALKLMGKRREWVR